MAHYQRSSNEERRRDRVVRAKEALQGEGLYVYKNNTGGDLQLPKPTLSGKKYLTKDEEFQGDNYFMRFIPSLFRLVRCIQPPQQPGDKIMTEQKLILDQPDRITKHGKAEDVIIPQKIKILEGQEINETEVLINEDPMSGVEIMTD